MMDHARTPSAGQDISGLRTLIRRHLQDREAIKAGRVRLIYFVDAHELKAYIHGVSEDYIEGFELGPERALRASRVRLDIVPQLRLKCELAIRWLLFRQPHPVIVLPSHGVEIEEEIAFQRHRDIARDLGLLAEARIQLRKLREGRFANTLISELAVRALKGDASSKEQLTAYLGRAAPALGVLLNILPTGIDSIQSRIEELIRDSRLTTLGSVRWSSYNLTEPEIDKVRSVGLDETRVRDWQRLLEARRTKSERSNRLDAEAIAYVEKLNASLAETQITARGVLVTHTGALVHASRARPHALDSLLGVNDPIRHIRLLAWDTPEALPAAGSPVSLADAQAKPPDPLGDAVERLEQALEVYNSQIVLRVGEATDMPFSEANALMDAWATFETARATLGLATKDVASIPLARDEALGTSEIERLLEWLQSEQELESLIADRLSRLVVTFGREVLTSEGAEALRVVVRSARARDGTHTQIIPIAPRMVGPVEFQSWQPGMDPGPRRVQFPGEGIELSDGSPRSYLALALLHATKDSLALAEVYTKAATDSADFLRQSPLAAEARLLSAQVLRMTSARATGGSSRTPDEIRNRLEDAQRLLTEAQRLNDTPRIHLERAAVHLERLLNNLDSDESTRRLFAQGLDAVESTFSRVREDDLIVRMRTAELALAYAITDLTVSRDYGTKGFLTPEFLEHWHRSLTATIDQLRANEDYLLEELPLLTRALEVIGYAMIHEEQVRAGHRPAVSGDCGIPNNLSLDIHSVQRGLNAYDDRVSQQMARILADINARSGSSWTYSFVHAPVWERSDVERATQTIADAEVRQAIRTANQMLHRVGDDQRILLGEPGQVAMLQEAEQRYVEIFECLTDAVSKPVRFLVQMEYCYARLLNGVHLSDKAQRQKQLRELATLYQALREEFGSHPTLLYRQSIVFGELDMHEEALGAIQEAQNSWDDNNHFLVGASWMKSTIRRRIGLHFSREAKDQLAQLKLGAPSEESYERYRATVRMAFCSTFEGFDMEPVDPSLRGKAEMLRRLNNIVFYASLFLQAKGSMDTLHVEFSEDRFRSYLDRLKAEAPTIEREWFYAHTIGAAHHVLGETVLAEAAANALLTLLAASGASTHSEAIRHAIEDAFSWKRVAASEARR